ncbi:hypothetical protein ACHAW6_000298 [Cyclotella cf. meneghiniana]
MSNPHTENNINNNDNEDDIQTSRRHSTVQTSLHLHTASGNLASRTINDDNDSPILLEDRLFKTIVSLHQLIYTNQQLNEALLKEAYDVDLFEALQENDELILQKTKNVTVMTQQLKELGVQVISLEEDDNMPVYCGSVVLRKLEEETVLPMPIGPFLC